MATSHEILEVDPHRVRRFKGQPRQHFDPVKLRQLRESIKSEGQHVTAIVKRVSGDPDHEFELTDGERRWLCCKNLGISFRVEVKSPGSEEDQFRLSVIANFAREDNSGIEIARAIGRIRQSAKIQAYENKVDQTAALAAMFGHSPAWIYEYEGLLRLVPEVQDLIDPAKTAAEGLLSHRVAVYLGSVPGEQQIEIAREIGRRGLNRSEALAFVRRQRRESGRRIMGNGRVFVSQDHRTVTTALGKFEEFLTSGRFDFSLVFVNRPMQRTLALTRADSLIRVLGEFKTAVEMAESAAVAQLEEPCHTEIKSDNENTSESGMPREDHKTAKLPGKVDLSTQTLAPIKPQDEPANCGICGGVFEPKTCQNARCPVRRIEGASPRSGVAKSGKAPLFGSGSSGSNPDSRAKALVEAPTVSPKKHCKRDGASYTNTRYGDYCSERCRRAAERSAAAVKSKPKLQWDSTLNRMVLKDEQGKVIVDEAADKAPVFVPSRGGLY